MSVEITYRSKTHSRGVLCPLSIPYKMICNSSLDNFKNSAISLLKYEDNYAPAIRTISESRPQIHSGIGVPSYRKNVRIVDPTCPTKSIMLN